MSNRPRSGETRSVRSPAEVFLTALTSSFPRQSSETRGLTGTQLSSFVTVCTPHVLSLNFPKLYFNLTKLPPHLSNFQKRVSEVSLFSSVIRKSVLVFLEGWIKKNFSDAAWTTCMVRQPSTAAGWPWPSCPRCRWSQWSVLSPSGTRGTPGSRSERTLASSWSAGSGEAALCPASPGG